MRQAIVSAVMLAILLTANIMLGYRIWKHGIFREENALAVTLASLHDVGDRQVTLATGPPYCRGDPRCFTRSPIQQFAERSASGCAAACTT